MTEKQMNKMGFFKGWGDRYDKYCDGRVIEIRVDKEDDLNSVWNKIYDDVFKQGEEAGRSNKSEEIKTALGL